MRSRIVIAGLFATLVLGACGESLEGKFDGDLFRAGCARCHAEDGSGGIGPAIGTADSNAAIVLTDEQIRGTILVGPGRMPSFDRLTNAQIDSVIAYVRDLQAGRVVIGE